MPEQVPLTTLLSWAWIAHTIEADNTFEHLGSELAGHHFRISLPMWSNGLRFITEDGLTIDELHRRARAACNIGGLERWGWIRVGDTGATRRDGYGTSRHLHGETVLYPTRGGRYARRLWPRVLAEVEGRWHDRFGIDAIEELGAALSDHARSMPWSPPEVHPSDGFFTHVLDGDEADDVVPFVAVLGQVLTGFTLDHEQASSVSMPLAADVLAAIGPAEVRIRDLPARSGLSKEGIAMAISYMDRNRLSARSADRTVHLTPVGLRALEDYQRRLPETPEARLRAALGTVLDQRDALSEGLVPPAGCWRGERPYLAQTKRLIADPTSALPRHPMVLHRGGWPDGS